eukprot:2343224-Prymnesium_polylepis.1
MSDLQIDLSQNDLQAKGGKAIAEAIAVSTSSTECNLRDNYLGTRGWCAIFNALRDNPQNAIAKWDLSSQGINTDIVKSLAAYMAVSTALTSVGINGVNLGPYLGKTGSTKDNNLGAEGWGAIFSAVCSSRDCKITSIDASRQELGVEGAKAVGKALQGSVSTSSLTQVNLANNALCGITEIGGWEKYSALCGINEIRGIYTAVGIKAIADALS